MSKTYLVTRESLLAALCSRDGCVVHSETVDKMLAAHEPIGETSDD